MNSLSSAKSTALKSIFIIIVSCMDNVMPKDVLFNFLFLTIANYLMHQCMYGLAYHISLIGAICYSATMVFTNHQILINDNCFVWGLLLNAVINILYWGISEVISNNGNFDLMSNMTREIATLATTVFIALQLAGCFKIIFLITLTIILYELYTTKRLTLCNLIFIFIHMLISTYLILTPFEFVDPSYPIVINKLNSLVYWDVARKVAQD